MKHIFLFTACILVYAPRVFGQDSLKTNPIIYSDFSITPITSVDGGMLADAGFNYQTGKSLFTLRLTGIGHMDIMTPYPNFGTRYTYAQGALLYGRRVISGGHSFSFSAGLAPVMQIATTNHGELPVTQTRSHYIGLPFEANLLWFKGKKRRSRIYGIIPYGKPTGFSSSVGLAVAGNVSAHSFVSFGVVFGLGYFRGY